jgi:membrane protein
MLARAGRRLKQLWAEMNRVRTLGLAAEMSFWIFLSLLPLAAVAAMVAARFTLNNGAITTPLLQSIPADARRVLTDELGKVAAWRRGSVAPIAAATFVWLASSGVHAIFDAFEAETGAERSWIMKRILALGTCIGLSVGVAAAALLGMGFSWLEALLGRVPAFEALESRAGIVARLIVGAAVLYGIVAALYRIGLPRAARAKMPLAPGTLLVVGMELVLGYGYRLSIAAFGNGGAYKAGLAAIGVTMTSIYLFSVSILVGLELNSVIGKARTERTAS